MSATQPAATGFGLNPQDELNDLRMSERAMPLLEHVKRFCAEAGLSGKRVLAVANRKVAGPSSAFRLRTVVPFSEVIRC